MSKNSQLVDRLPQAHPQAYTSSAAVNSAARPPFRPDIEGVRGIAVLLVVFYHAAVPGVTGGYVGVDVFFVLSGYLITWLLVREVEKTGTIDLKSFYARRARRLLPAMGVLLVAVAGFAIVFYSPMEQELISATAFSTAAYVSNLFFGYFATDYLAGAAEVNPLLHTWSLSVEEQFYVFWPVFVLAALTAFGRRGANRRRLMAAMTAVAIASFGLTLGLQALRLNHWAFFASPTRAWEFALGGLGVLLPLYGSPRHRSLFGWLGLVAVIATGFVYTARTPFPGWAALLPGLGTVFVLRACSQPDGSAAESSGLSRLLGIAPLQHLGRLSYSWYLWHWPVLVFAAGLAFTEIEQLPAAQRAALMILSLALAEASYRLIENPVRHHRGLALTPVRGLVLGLVLTLVGGGLAFSWKEWAQYRLTRPPYEQFAKARQDRVIGCIATTYESSLDTCVFGDSASSTTIVLFGDSHAHHWLSAIVKVAEIEKWKLVTVMKSGCPVVQSEIFSPQLGRRYYECEEWRRSAVGYVANLRPKVVISSNSYKYDINMQQWSVGLKKYISNITYHGAFALHIRDVPLPSSDIPRCLSEGRNQRRCDFRRDQERNSEIYKKELIAVQDDSMASMIDMNPYVCPLELCDVFRGGIVVYRDDNHISSSFAESLVPILAPVLKNYVERTSRD